MAFIEKNYVVDVTSNPFYGEQDEPRNVIVSSPLYTMTLFNAPFSFYGLFREQYPVSDNQYDAFRQLSSHSRDLDEALFIHGVKNARPLAKTLAIEATYYSERFRGNFVEEKLHDAISEADSKSLLVLDPESRREVGIMKEKFAQKFNPA